MQLDFNRDLKQAPPNIYLLVLLEDGTIHTAHKVPTQYHIESECGEFETWMPVGIDATRDGTPFFDSEVVGWVDYYKKSLEMFGQINSVFDDIPVGWGTLTTEQTTRVLSELLDKNRDGFKDASPLEAYMDVLKSELYGDW